MLRIPIKVLTYAAVILGIAGCDLRNGALQADPLGLSASLP